MKVDFPYLIPDTDRHGNVRYYFRRKGQRKIRIRGTPGTPAFQQAYEDARDGKAVIRPKLMPASPSSFRWLVQQYCRSQDFLELGESTRRVRRLILEGICLSKTPKGIERGTLPFALMEERHVKEIRDEKGAELPEAANGRLKALRQLFKWAKTEGHITANPARDVSRMRGNPEGWHTWTDEEVAQFEAHFPIGTKARLAFGLYRYTGVRISDVVRLGKGMERMLHTAEGEPYDGLRFTMTKNRKKRAKPGEPAPGPKVLELPILPQLREILDATPSGHMTYLVTEWGKPFTVAGFGNKMRDWCDEAGLPQCSSHGIRKFDASTAADNGATTHQLMAMFGWESVRQAEAYTRRANKKKLAKGAMHLLAPIDENKNIAKVSHRSESGTLGKKSS